MIANWMLNPKIIIRSPGKTNFRERVSFHACGSKHNIGLGTQGTFFSNPFIPGVFGCHLVCLSLINKKICSKSIV